MEGLKQESVGCSKYEPSFRCWLVQEIKSGWMSWQKARSRFELPYRFDTVYRFWPKKCSDEIIISLSVMTAKEKIDYKKLETRNKELEKELEQAQMKVVAINVMIDIAEKDC